MTSGYDGLVTAWRSLERAHDLGLTLVPCDANSESLMRVDIGDASTTPSVAISAGVHGDEPAAPWALLSLVRDGLLAQRFAYRIWCCTNPTGYHRGTRGNANGDDVNRSFSRDSRSAGTPQARAIERANRGWTFTLSLDLHEDYEADGFYCYEGSLDRAEVLASGVVQAMDDSGLPAQDLVSGFDLGYPPEATHLRDLARGGVYPNVAAEVRHFDGLPYSMYLLWTHTAQRTMTLESPRSRAWDERIAIHRVAVVAALTACGHAA